MLAQEMIDNYKNGSHIVTRPMILVSLEEKQKKQTRTICGVMLAATVFGIFKIGKVFKK